MEAYARKIPADREGGGLAEVTVANGIIIRKYRGRGKSFSELEMQLLAAGQDGPGGGKDGKADKGV